MKLDYKLIILVTPTQSLTVLPYNTGFPGTEIVRVKVKSWLNQGGTMKKWAIGGGGAIKVLSKMFAKVLQTGIKSNI